MRTLFANHPVCAIMRHVPMEQTLEYSSAIVQGGIKLFEVALNTPHGLEQIMTLRHYFGDDIIIGAGTVLNPEQACEAQEAGAQFILTPSVNTETLSYCCQSNIPVLPGVMTPTDVSQCLAFGITTMKLFPAGDLAKGYIKSLQGPFDATNYVAVGGVTKDNLALFFQQGFVGVGMGSSLIPKAYAANGLWKDATKWVASIVDCCNKYRNPKIS